MAASGSESGFRIYRGNISRTLDNYCLGTLTVDSVRKRSRQRRNIAGAPGRDTCLKISYYHLEIINSLNK